MMPKIDKAFRRDHARKRKRYAMHMTNPGMRLVMRELAHKAQMAIPETDMRNAESERLNDD